jgi:hypothetical protein
MAFTGMTGITTWRTHGFCTDSVPHSVPVCVCVRRTSAIRLHRAGLSLYIPQTRLCTIHECPRTNGLIPPRRQKDVMTALRYLAASYGTTPDLLPLTPAIETTYRQQLREHLTAQGKGHSTVRNSIQGVGQYLKAVHAILQTPPLSQAAPQVPRSNATFQAMRLTSPYGHQAFLTTSPYFLKVDQWPAAIRTPFKAYQSLKKHQLRQPTLAKQERDMQALVGYLSMTGPQRLEKLPPQALAKLQLSRYADDRAEILETPVLSTWDDLFVEAHLDSFLTWHAWRAHTPSEAAVRERSPSRPTSMSAHVVKDVAYIAQALDRDDALDLRAYQRRLPPPKRIHNKQAELHTFGLDELEAVGHAMLREARRTRSSARDAEYPGSVAATRFQAGLILMLALSNPMRARNWCEALLDTNLRKVNGAWHWRFEGRELKIGTRRGEPNVLDSMVDPDVATYLEEYLEVWRPKLPNAAKDRHVFLSKRGRPFTDTTLRNRLRINVYRYTKKHLYTHLLRTIFTSQALSDGEDINTVAYGLNDTPATVLRAYNELSPAKHQRAILERVRRLAKRTHGESNGHGNASAVPQ